MHLGANDIWGCKVAGGDDFSLSPNRGTFADESV